MKCFPVSPWTASGVFAAGLACLLLSLPAPLLGQGPRLPQPVLSSSLGDEDPVSTDGTLDLSWQVDEHAAGAVEDAVSFELEETANGARILIDVGAHLAAALSGRDEGLYRYRVRAVSKRGPAGPWSEPIDVRVEHHSLSFALALFGIGAAVFLATASLVLTGHCIVRRTARLTA